MSIQIGRKLIIISLLALGGAELAYLFGDLSITRFIQRFDNPYIHALMVAVSWPGYGYHQWVVVLGVTAALLRLRLRIEAACLLIGYGSAWSLANVIKLIVARPRPAPDLVRVYLSHPTWSFPSGHVVTYMALYGFLFYLVRSRMRPSFPRSALLAVLGSMIGLVGLSRVYLGAHWASDALGGYCFGLVCLALMIHFYTKLRSPV